MIRADFIQLLQLLVGEQSTTDEQLIQQLIPHIEIKGSTASESKAEDDNEDEAQVEVEVIAEEDAPSDQTAPTT